MSDRATYMREYRRSHPDYRLHEREYHREWTKKHPTYYRDRKRQQVKTESGKVLARLHQAIQRKRHPNRIKARLHGRYVEQDTKCAKCGSLEHLERHHPDYSNPDLVITLCRSCHRQEHWGAQ